MISQSELGRRFESGATSGTASNVEIQEAPNGGTVLVGYGHAVYAYRSPGGHITVYRGWTNRNNTRRHSGSMSTKCQYTALGLGSAADDVVEGDGTDAAPKSIGFQSPQLA